MRPSSVLYTNEYTARPVTTAVFSVGELARLAGVSWHRLNRVFAEHRVPVRKRGRGKANRVFLADLWKLTPGIAETVSARWLQGRTAEETSPKRAVAAPTL